MTGPDQASAHALQDVEAAHRSLRDLMGLLAMPGLWAGRDGQTILQLMMDAIERIVDVDASFIGVPLLPNTPPMLSLRIQGETATTTELDRWQPTLQAWQQVPVGARAIALPSPIGELWVVRLGMAYSSEQGSVWFADRRAGFPMLTEHAFLRAAASLAANGVLMARTAYEREQASRAKDEFLAMLGHEIRNPLAPITTALELIKRRSGQPFDKYHAIIERQVKHLSQLVDDLLDISRVTRGTIELRHEPLRIGSVLTRAVEAVSPVIEQHRHQLVLNVSDGGVQFSGDMTRLVQVFTNLLTNAAKFTPPQGLLRLDAWTEAGRLHVSVSDNGAGIDADVMPRLFKIFEQGRTTIDRSRGGLGIGLALVKSLVELHGGAVTVASDGSGQGSRFTVSLPTGLPAPTSDVLTAPAEAVSRPDSSPGLRVLLVDDNADALESMGQYLQDAGYIVLTAADPLHALQIAPAFNPHCAVLDIGLPGIDGYELAGELKKVLGVSARLKLFALSGYGQVSDKQRSAAAGFEQHFVKPVSLETLARALQQGAG